MMALDRKKRITDLFIILVGILIAVYDILAWAGMGVSTTITWRVRSWDDAFPLTKWIVAALMVVLWGHFFGDKITERP